ncbi:MAG: response regulator transcription factor [Lachnospiraceae bacterium]|nr:response regulator transcription factor [Lachnospiraceae bacterium]
MGIWKAVERVTMEIAVCDDEKRICEDIKERILKKEPECRVTCLSSGEELLARALEWDIVFLDIGLKEANGIEIAEKLHEYPGLLVIFVTAHPEHVFEAFDVGAFHYLLKPLDDEKFCHVFERAMNHVKQKKERQPLQVKEGNAYRFIPLSEIYYAESSGRKILLHTQREIVEFYGRMQELERRLGNDFFRCHRGYLVHLQYVSGYDAVTVFLKNGESVYLAKQKCGEFAAAYAAYLRRVIP